MKTNPAASAAGFFVSRDTFQEFRARACPDVSGDPINLVDPSGLSEATLACVNEDSEITNGTGGVCSWVCPAGVACIDGRVTWFEPGGWGHIRGGSGLTGGGESDDEPDCNETEVFLANEMATGSNVAAWVGLGAGLVKATSIAAGAALVGTVATVGTVVLGAGSGILHARNGLSADNFWNAAAVGAAGGAVKVISVFGRASHAVGNMIDRVRSRPTFPYLSPVSAYGTDLRL